MSKFTVTVKFVDGATVVEELESSTRYNAIAIAMLRARQKRKSVDLDSIDVVVEDEAATKFVVVSSDGYEEVRDAFDTLQDAEGYAADHLQGAHKVRIERIEVVKVVKGDGGRTPDQEVLALEGAE